MLGILAQSLMIATRMDRQVWARDVPTKTQRWWPFWRGRKWRKIDLDDL